MTINQNYLDLKDSYLFSTIAKKVTAYQKENPSKHVIRLGIGDVTLPLPQASVTAMEKAANEMGAKSTFRGYGDDQGYLFLRTAFANYYSERGVVLDVNEIFVSDGAKSDIGNILDIFSTDNTVLIPDPVYPVYVDTNIMAGRKIVYVNGTLENDFISMPDESIHADIIYLCSPNNPTGSVYSKAQLTKWVEYALAHKAVILFDAAYEAYIQDENLPRSIYEIEGAKKCAIEFCSLSKTAGFTGTRCGYTVVPFELMSGDVSLNKLWLRRQTTKFNGVPYIVQRGAEAVFSKEGRAQAKENILYYLGNAKIISDALSQMGVWYVGGKNSPYIWLKCEGNMTSWRYFDYLLENANIVGTPGVGFGKNGEGFFRLTAFGDRENVKTAIQRILDLSKRV